jgi:protein disulfide-isomerase
MKLKLIMMLGLLAFAVSGFAAQAKWLTDYDAALAQAKQENKRVLIDFTGSDWCGWCIKFDEEVYSQSKFINYARDKYVLLKLDYPKNKKQSDAEKAANQKWKSQYRVGGFPTTVILNSEGREIGRFVGYQEGGPKAFIGQLEKLEPSSGAASQ